MHGSELSCSRYPSESPNPICRSECFAGNIESSLTPRVKVQSLFLTRAHEKTGGGATEVRRVQTDEGGKSVLRGLEVPHGFPGDQSTERMPQKDEVGEV